MEKVLEKVRRRFLEYFSPEPIIGSELKKVILKIDYNLPVPAQTIDNKIKINPELLKGYSLERTLTHELAHVYLKFLDIRDLVEERDEKYRNKIFRFVVSNSEEVLLFYAHGFNPSGLFEEMLKNGNILSTKKGKEYLSKIKDDPVSTEFIKFLTTLDLILQAVTSLGYEKNTTSEILSEYIACCFYPKESLKDNLKSIKRLEVLKETGTLPAYAKIEKLRHLIGIAVYELEGNKYLRDLPGLYKYVLENSEKVAGKIKEILEKNGLLWKFISKEL